MTTERDRSTRIVLSWLREDAHENAERVLLRTLDEVDTTPQRRSWWPAWRPEQMRTSQILVAAAAVLVVAFLGYNLLPGLGGPSPTTPTVAPTATAAPPSNPPRLTNGPLEPGTYTVTSNTNMPFTVSVPAGWRGDENFIVKGDGTAEEVAFDGTGVALATWVVSHVYTDSCQWEGTLQEVTTAGDIARALSIQAGHETGVSLGTGLGGQPAILMNLSLAAEFDVATCDSSFVRLWPDAGPQEQFGLPIYPGQTSSVYVVDHGTQATLVIAIKNAESTVADVAELESVVASIEFMP